MPKSTTKLGWLVKLKSIQGLELSEMWFGSFKSLVSPYWHVKLSSLAPSGVVLSVKHHLLNLALKSPMMTVRKEFFCVSASSVKSKL